MNSKLYLASRSPRRAQLLHLIGVSFEVLDVDLLEVPGANEAAADYVIRMAGEKAAAGSALVVDQPDARVLAADTEVVLDGVIFGKPVDADDAARMLRLLSGREHDVLTGVALADRIGTQVALNRTQVRFAELSEAAIADYIATGEPFGKSGAYGIQGHASAFIPHITGSYTAVMGLPLFETAELLAGKVGPGS